MSTRLKIGAYIIDSALTGSTSTTSGVRLLLNEGPGFKHTDGKESAVITAVAQVTAANEAALKTAVDTLRNQVVETPNVDLVFEYAAASTLASWLVSTNQYSRIDGQVEIDWGEETALVLMVFTAQRIAPASTGDGDAVNSLGPIEWTFSEDASGRPDCSGSVAFETRTDATNWIQLLRTGAARPDWMGSAFRFITPIISMEQQGNQISPAPDSAYTPALVTVLFSALPAAFAADSAFDNVVDASYECSGKARRPLHEDAGIDTGLDVVLSGSIQFKTEKDETFDAADTTVTADSALKDAALAAIDVMEANAKTRSSLTWTRTRDPELVVGSSGIVTFLVTAVTGDEGRVLEWNDSTTLRRVSRNRIVSGSKGDRVYEHKLGPILRGSHQLFIRSLSPAEYVPPDFLGGGEWEELSFAPSRPIPEATLGEGPIVYSQTWQGEWQKLSGGDREPTGVYAYETVAGA